MKFICKMFSRKYAPIWILVLVIATMLYLNIGTNNKVKLVDEYPEKVKMNVISE